MSVMCNVAIIQLTSTSTAVHALNSSFQVLVYATYIVEFLQKFASDPNIVDEVALSLSDSRLPRFLLLP